MVKIAATQDLKVAVRAPVADVFGFFSDPSQIREMSVDVASFELKSPMVARFLLTEKVEKGVRFQADYTVEYSPYAPDRVAWRSVAGNMDVEGEVRLRAVDAGNTEIHYRETVAPDLPITRLTAMLFKPIVARELRQDISKFLDRVVGRLNGPRR